MERVVDGPWTGSWRSYAGWVPNVRSHLSFSMIGAAKGALTFTRLRLHQPVRVVIAHQRRVVNDFPVPRWVAERLRPGIVVHWVLEGSTESIVLPVQTTGGLVAERDRQGVLRGRIHFLPRQEGRAARRIFAAALDNLDFEMRGWRSRPDKELDGVLNEVRVRARTSGVHVSLEFALLRTGECRLWYDAPIVGLSRARMDRIAEQAYYFVKDLVHEHTHHDASSDQITPLVRHSPSVDEPDHSHEVAWRRETLWSLSREVERLNRDGGLTNQRRSLGVIAYAEAFQSALMGYVRDSSKPSGFMPGTKVHDFDFKHLKDSVKADIDVTATRQSQSVQVTIAAAATFVSTTALVSSLVGTHNGALRALQVERGAAASTSGEPRTGTPSGMPGDAHGAIGVGNLDAVLPALAWNPALSGLTVTVILLGVVSYFLLDGRAGLFTRSQRVISQFGRALSTSLSRRASRQWMIDVLFHFACTIAVGAIVLEWIALMLRLT